MFGLLGLLGAVMAGFLVDALTVPSHGHPDDGTTSHDADQISAASEGAGSFPHDPGAASDHINHGIGALPTNQDSRVPLAAVSHVSGAELWVVSEAG